MFITGMRKIIPNEILFPEVRQLLSEGRDVIILAKGASMMPFIRGDRDSVLLRKKERVSVGDMCLVCIAKKNYILHRVISMDGDNVTLMGDGNLCGTEKCTLDDVCGTVIEIIKPSGKRIVPGNGEIWRKLKPFRRIILAIYRRII